MKALPAEFTQQEYESVLDSSVRFVVMPLDNLIYSHIHGRNLEVGIEEDGTPKFEINAGGQVFDTVGFALISIDGLEDFEPKFIDVMVGGEIYRRMTNASMKRIPTKLFNEIKVKITRSIQLMQDEIENMGFTPDSSSQESNVTETSQDAPVETGNTRLENESIEPDDYTESQSPDVPISE